MRTLHETAVLKKYDLTHEEEYAALRTFSAEQLAMFHNMLTESLLMRAAIVYDPENPLSQCTASFELDGKIKLLKILLSEDPQLKHSNNSPEGDGNGNSSAS